MISWQFDYVRPGTIDEATTLMHERGGAIKILAGGTDLLVRMQKGVIRPINLLSLRDLPLNQIRESEEEVEIGSTVVLTELGKSEFLAKHYTALWEGIRQIGAVQVRNRATLGGNICNAAPSADSAPPLLVFGGEVQAMSAEGIRWIPLCAFFTGPGQTVLRPDELVTAIRMPRSGQGSSSAYQKARRTAEDIALVGVAALVEVTSAGMITDLRVAIGAAAPTPLLVPDLVEIVRDARVDKLDLDQIGELAVQACRPIDDVRSSATYRKHLVKTLTKRAILAAIERNPLKPMWGGACNNA